MIKKLIITILLVAAGLVSFIWLSVALSSSDASFYAGVQEQLNGRLVSASLIFGLAKLAAGILSFLQTIQVEAGIVLAGVKISPLEILGPVADTIDKLSNLFLIAMGAIILQKILMLVTGWFCFKIAVPVSAVLGAVYVWTGRKSLRKAAIVLTVISVAIWTVVPLSVKVSAVVEKHFLTDMMEEARLGVEANKSAISGIQGELGGENRITFTNKVKTMVSDSLEYAKAMITDLVNALIVVLMTVLVIPLGTVLFLWLLLRWLIRHAL